MAWAEFRITKNGIARRRNPKTQKWEVGMWYCIGRDPVTGKGISRPVGLMDNYKHVRREVEDIENGNVKGGETAKAIPLGVPYKEYEIEIKKAKAPRTWRAYKWGVDKLVDIFKESDDIRNIKSPDILRFRAKIMEAHSVNGMLDILKYVRAFFTYCVKLGYLEINPASGSLAGYKPKAVAHFLTDEEARHILSCCKIKEFGDIIRVALLTGMREEELANMRSSWISGGSLHVHGKGSKDRVIPIFSKAGPILEPYLKSGGALVFSGWNVGRIRQAWRRLIARAKKTMPLGRTRFHDLRHTFASNFLNDGGQIEDLQEMLGHDKLTTTMIYRHKRPSRLGKEIEKMKASFLEATPPEFRPEE